MNEPVNEKQAFIELLTRHVYKVGLNIHSMIIELSLRAIKHDASKFEDEESSYFIEYSPKLRHMEYGSDEYKDCLEKMRPALNHHYEVNSHHPEHYPNGFTGMNLVDIVELLADWKAAAELSKNGDIRRSIEYNQYRFGYSDDVKQILLNTVDYLGWK
jgi:hypothetical protein